MSVHPSLAFLACVERGSLEPETLLLCRSIRRFGGPYRDAAIHTFRPRRGANIAMTTREQLAELGVIHHDRVLNTDLPEYGMGNKVFVCAWAERRLPEDVLVFCDSDTVMIGEPEALALPKEVSAAVRPADSVPLNSTGPGHPLEPYWNQVYEFCRLDHVPYVQTELGRRVRAFFSAGLIAVRRERGLFARWQSNLLTLVAAGLLPPDFGITRMDEVALAATLIPHFDDLQLLDQRYNYLIYRRSRLMPPWRHAPLSNLVHVHYRDSFRQTRFMADLDPPLPATCPIRDWLQSYLPLDAEGPADGVTRSCTD